jgi:hypothetical protein
MRRGLISWSKEELPPRVLEDRVQRVQATMHSESLDLVLIYTTFAQPAASHWVCNFTPYWSEAMVAVLPQGAPLLLAALTPRVHPWIRSVSHLGDVLNTPRLGEGVLAFVREHVAPGGRVGVVGLAEMPFSVMRPIALAGVAESLVDASAIFAALRQPADEYELTLASRALRIAADAMDAIPASAAGVSQVAASIERCARLAGAEEVLLRIAPDLHASTPLSRMEGDAPLGPLHAVEASVAYKGAWVRYARSLTRGAQMPRDWSDAGTWFRNALAHLTRHGTSSPLPHAPGEVRFWTLEACTGMHPLTVVADNGLQPDCALPAGSLAVFSVELQLAQGIWNAAAPVHFHASGGHVFPLGEFAR